MILIVVLLTYYKDCKSIGKDNLAVTLGERLAYYIAFVLIPVVYSVIGGLLK